MQIHPIHISVNFKASKMDARLASLERRLLKNQEEKHEEIVNILAKLHNPEDGGEVSTLCFNCIINAYLVHSFHIISGGQAPSNSGRSTEYWF